MNSQKIANLKAAENDPAFEPVHHEPTEYADVKWGAFEENPKRPTYIVPELELGPGRAFGWIGASNVSKTLAVMQLEIDVALGRAVFGRFDVLGGARNVVHLAYEGFVTAPENYVRLARAAGADLREMNARLRFGLPNEPIAARTHEGLELNEDWLCEIAPEGGLLVIDPLVAAVRGLDENSAEISEPIYMLERVSERTGCAVILLHHLNASGERERGSSSIQGAFGGRVNLNKVEGQRHQRRFDCGKAIRYGFESFEVEIRDTDSSGRAWEWTPERARAGECSWGVSVASLHTRPETATERKAKAAEATIEKHAQALIDSLRRAYPEYIKAAQLRSDAGLSGTYWPAAIKRAIERGEVEASPGSKYVWREPPKNGFSVGRRVQHATRARK